MAVKRVDLLAGYDSESLNWSEDAAREDRTVGTARYRYAVHVDRIQEIDDDIRNASGPSGENGENGIVTIYELGTTAQEPNVIYTGKDPQWILSSKEVSKIGNLYYQVDCTWTRLAAPDTSPTYTVNGVRVEETAYYDMEDKPIVNSSGAPFDPPLVKTYYDQEILVSFQTWGINEIGRAHV